MIEELHEYIGGVPFVDEGVKLNNILSLVALKRKKLSSLQDDIQIERFASPDVAEQIYLSHPDHSRFKIDSVPLSKSQTLQIDHAKGLILENKRSWSGLFHLPLRFRALKDDRVSSSCLLIPQTIFFGKAAFASEELLIDSYLHELSHIWLDLIIEIVDLQKPDAKEFFLVPSGKEKKCLRGILQAAHFAASLMEYYKPINEERYSFLKKYLNTSLCLIDKSKEFSDYGMILVERLRQVNKG